MTESNHLNDKDLQPQLPGSGPNDELDAAGRSLSEALRISFAILKIIMIVLVVLFLVSGFETVGSDEQALVLQFGKIHGVREGRILYPGLHWVFPYPIDRIVKIPVAKKTNLAINSFWYYQKESEKLPLEPAEGEIRPGPTLDPIRDGYCITQSERRSRSGVTSAGSDYNIVHLKWQLTYQIDDPVRFFKNTYVDMSSIERGQSYADVIPKNINRLLEDMVAGAVVTTMVRYTIDEVISSQERIPRAVKELLQEQLDRIESGIKVVSVQLTDVTWPRQVNDAFFASIKASQESQRLISQALLYAEKTLNEAAGPVAEELLAVIKNEADADDTQEQQELLWSQLAGQAQEQIAQARAYRTRVVETARANAEYLQNLLPEYRKRPELVIQKIYQDAVEQVLNNADEKMIIQPTEGAKGREIRILLNRDPSLKPKSEKEQ